MLCCEIDVNLEEEDEEAYVMSSSDNDDSSDSEFQGMLLKSYVMFF